MLRSADRRDDESGKRLKEAAAYLGAVDQLHRPDDVHGGTNRASRQSHLFVGIAGAIVPNRAVWALSTPTVPSGLLLLRISPVLTAQIARSRAPRWATRSGAKPQ